MLINNTGSLYGTQRFNLVKKIRNGKAIPISAGGYSNLDDAKKLVSAGADKIVVL